MSDRIGEAFDRVVRDLRTISVAARVPKITSIEQLATPEDFEIVERCAQRAELDRIFNSRETLEARAPANLRRARA